MTTTESYRFADTRSDLWFGRWPSGWGDVVQTVAPDAGATAEGMIEAAGLGALPRRPRPTCARHTHQLAQSPDR